jgi:2-phosphosulfolactate phosphatase
MILSVAVVPCAVRDVERSVCVVVDVLRASSTMLAMFESGASELFLAATPGEALATAAKARTGHWVCGEENGLRPPDFDYGNSPTEIAGVDLKGRRVVYATSNGTNALRSVHKAPLVLVGSPRNALAVARLAAREADTRGCDILVVCAGDEGGAATSLEDAYCAGLLVDRFQRHDLRLVPPEEARSQPHALALDESAILAHRLFRSYQRPQLNGPTAREPLLGVFSESRNGRDLPRKGFAADLDYCAEVDVTTVVPRLVVRDGLLAVLAAP